MDLSKFANKRARIAKPKRDGPPPQSRTLPARNARVPPSATASSSSRDCEQTSSTWDPTERDWTKYLQRGSHGPMRLLFVGHNPSQKSWELAAPYAHNSNYFWKIMRVASFAPAEMCTPGSFVDYPRLYRIGFADLFVTMGSVASDVSAPRGDENWQVNEFCPRVSEACGGIAPRVVALVSKAVAQKLLRGWKGDFGRVGTGEEWGLTGLEASEIWVMPSTSGRAVLSWEDRLRPYQELSDYVTNELAETEAVDEVVDDEGS